MNQRFDIGIVGAGPAGARAAELLARAGARVVVWDPKAPWEKPCGGGLTAAVFRNVPDLEGIIPWTHEVSEVRIESEPGGGFTVPLDAPLRVVSRLDLSRWQLQRALDAGAVVVKEAVRTIRHIPGGWLVETAERGGTRVSMLVGADGAASLVRRTAAPGLDVELIPTRVRYPEGSGPTPEAALMRFYGDVAGYLWDFPRKDHRSVGIGLPGKGWSRAQFDGEIDRHMKSASSCGCKPGGRAGAVIGTAQLGHGDYRRIAGHDFALLGDAAGFADPTTGEGIQNALRSARLLADAWIEAGDFSAYPEKARRTFEHEFRVGRLARRAIFESGLGDWVIRRAMRATWAYALVATLTNASNSHDWGVGSLLRGWLRTWRSARRVPSKALGTGHVAAACDCGRPDDAARPEACATDGARGVERETAEPSVAA